MSLQERHDSMKHEMDLLDEKIQAIQSGRVKHQAKDGLDEPWRDSTDEMLNHYRHTKKTYERLSAELAERISNGEA